MRPVKATEWYYLPKGYEYRLLQIKDEVKVIGVSSNKVPVIFEFKNGKVIRKDAVL